MRTVTLLFFVMAALTAVLGFGAALGSLGGLMRILFAAFGALCVISFAIYAASAFDEGGTIEQ